MHGFAKRGLALAAATSGLIMGVAGAAAADATATATSTLSGGLASGNVADAPVAVPVNFCGNQALAAALMDTDLGSPCTISAGSGAAASESVTDSGGIAAGNAAGIAASVPVNACGNQAAVGSVGSSVGASTCTVSGASGATATGTTTDSPGVLSGNILGAALSVPINACGNQADGLGVANTVAPSTCSIG